MNQEWNIRSQGDTCAASGRSFDDGAEIVSRLMFGEEGYVREDFSEADWDESLRDTAISVWRGIYRAPPATPEEPLKKETAESLLRQLIETEDEANLNVIFILAVMLERKRVLVERDVHTRGDGLKLRVYEHRKSGEMFMIPDPELKLAELETVQAEVAERLGSPRDHTSPASSTKGGDVNEAPLAEGEDAQAAPS